MTKIMLEGRTAQFLNELNERDNFESACMLAYHDGVIETTRVGTWEGIGTLLFEALRMHCSERHIPVEAMFEELSKLGN